MRIRPLELKNKVLIPQLKNSLKTAFTASSIILLAVSFATTSCSSNKPEEIKAISSRENLPELVYNELETVLTDSGRVKYRFLAPEVMSYKYKEEPYIDFPSGFHLFVYDAKGEVETQIKCMNAIYYEKPQELWELNNDVQGINMKGEVLNTEQLFWDMKEARLYTDKFVKITTPTQIITGTGLESDQTLSNWRIKNVSGELEIEE